VVGDAAARLAAGKSGAGCVVPQIAQIFADGIGGMLHDAMWVSGARPSINLRKSAKSADTNQSNKSLCTNPQIFADQRP